MGYVGQAPVSVGSVTSTDILDGTVASADLADNQVTVAKLADIARGSLIVGNASAATAELTKGSASTVLTSDGTDIAWAAAAAGYTDAEAIAAVEAEPTLALTGQVMAAAQPGFHAVNSTANLNITGDGTAITAMEFDTEIYDIGGDYNNGTNTFTAPVTGKYIISVLLGMEQIASNHASICQITTSNRSYRIEAEYGVSPVYGTDVEIHGTVIADMDAGDTATIYLQFYGGSKTVDFRASFGVLNYFSAHLLPS